MGWAEEKGERGESVSPSSWGGVRRRAQALGREIEKEIDKRFMQVLDYWGE